MNTMLWWWQIAHALLSQGLSIISTTSGKEEEKEKEGGREKGKVLASGCVIWCHAVKILSAGSKIVRGEEAKGLNSVTKERQIHFKRLHTFIFVFLFTCFFPCRPALSQAVSVENTSVCNTFCPCCLFRCLFWPWWRWSCLASWVWLASSWAPSLWSSWSPLWASEWSSLFISHW